MTFLLMNCPQSSFSTILLGTDIFFNALFSKNTNQTLNKEYRSYMAICNSLKLHFDSPLRFMNAIDMINITRVLNIPPGDVAMGRGLFKYGNYLFFPSYVPSGVILRNQCR